MLAAVTITQPMSSLVDALAALRDRVAAVRLPLGLPDAAAARDMRSELVGQLDDYLLPRLRRPDLPLLVVVAGSTGAGKSTLVNSLIRQNVTKAGVLRPTTRTPVLVAHPDDVPALTGPERLLPRLARTPGPTGKPDTIMLAANAAIPRGAAIIDSPDLNSVVEANRYQAERLMMAVDAWLLVTTAERYADVVPWRMLTVARERRTPLAVVLDRVPPDALHDVRDACKALLAANGFEHVPLFVVPETIITDGMVPEYLLDPIMTWLRGPAYDESARAELLIKHLSGQLDSLRGRVGMIAAAVSSQVGAVDQLTTHADRAYAAQRAALYDAVDTGALFRGELLVYWQRFLASDEARTLLGGVVPSAGRVVGAELRAAIVTHAGAAVAAALDRAGDQVTAGWRTLPGGDEALIQHPDFTDPDLAVEPTHDQTGLPRRRGTDTPPPTDAEAVFAAWLATLPSLIARRLADAHPAHRAADEVEPLSDAAAVLLATAVLAGLTPGDLVRDQAATSRAASSASSAAAASSAPPSAAVEAARELVVGLLGASEAHRLVDLARVQLDIALGEAFDRVAARHRRRLAELGITEGQAIALQDAYEAVVRNR
jgi:hypothetical protein